MFRTTKNLRVAAGFVFAAAISCAGFAMGQDAPDASPTADGAVEGELSAFITARMSEEEPSASFLRSVEANFDGEIAAPEAKQTPVAPEQNQRPREVDASTREPGPVQPVWRKGPPPVPPKVDDGASGEGKRPHDAGAQGERDERLEANDRNGRNGQEADKNNDSREREVKPVERVKEFGSKVKGFFKEKF